MSFKQKEKWQAGIEDLFISDQSQEDLVGAGGIQQCQKDRNGFCLLLR